jgi:hypothetical protein
MQLRDSSVLETMPTSEEQKRAPRLIAFLTVALSEGTAHYVVDTENLSETGLCLCPQKLFPVGTQLHLVFGQLPELPMITAQGIVKWFEGGKGVGVEFTSISADDQQSLLRFVNSQSGAERA